MHPLLDAFETACSRQPERCAASDQSLTLDYPGLRTVAAGLAAQIAEQTREPHVGILAPTSTACAAAVFAAWYAGKIPVPLNFLLAPQELGAIIRDAGLDLIVTIEKFAPLVGAAASSAGPRGSNPQDAPAPESLRTLLLNARTLVPAQRSAPDAAPEDVGVILYTSGTTGDPKGVCLTFSNLVSNALSAVERARITPDQTFLSVLPQFHSFGFTVMTVAPLILGATVVYLPRFSPLTAVNTIAERNIAVFLGVASMYAAMGQLKNVAPGALASLKLAVSGGEPLSRGIAERFEARFGVPIMEGYGLTESSPVVSLNTPWENRPGSVGRPIPGVEVFATDGNGTKLPAETEGELAIRGSGVMRGYHGRPEATAAVVRNGTLFTGDIGQVDAEGYIHITGRAKDMLIVSGENVFPREIENVLMEHPAVAEAAVVGRRDDVRGELPVGFVILKDGQSTDETELRNYCRDRLAGFKVPREIRIEADLPRGPTGKVLKRALHP